MQLNGLPRFLIPWSPTKIAELERLAAGEKPYDHPIEIRLAKAQLAVAGGDLAMAETIVLSAMEEHAELYPIHNSIFIPLLEAAIVTGQLGLVGNMFKIKYQLSCGLDFRVEETGPETGRFRWDVCLPEAVSFTFGPWLYRLGHPHVPAVWFAWIFPLFSNYIQNWRGENGSVLFNNWDEALGPGLGMCSNRSDVFLVPDNAFVASVGYTQLKRQFSDKMVPWGDRHGLAFWRGSTTGHIVDRSVGWPSLPRVRLCEIGLAHPDLMDTGISRIVQVSNQSIVREIEAAGLMRAAVAVTEFGLYKYQIDIDGNTNAWPGLFHKLLSGSPVLKIASRYGYRQWYYDKLRPWLNFVPIMSDMSDLVEKIKWLRAHDSVAQTIGENGRALAFSLEYDNELSQSTRTIEAALRYFAGQPELSVTFGSDADGNAMLRDGWHPPEERGVPAHGPESRLELERPVAATDAIIFLDISAYTDPPGPSAQRVAISANGTIVHQSKIQGRERLRCPLTHEVIISAPTLRLTLLQPDACVLASPLRPLDERPLSLILHELSLHPVSALLDGSQASATVRSAKTLSQPPPDHGAHDPLSDGVPVEMLRVPLQYLTTWHETIVMVDIATRSLRHGLVGASARNAYFAVNGARGCILRMAVDGSLHAIQVPPAPGGGAINSASPDGAPQLFDVVPVDGGGFGLRNQGLYLCAEPDGRVTLSRSQLSWWETFKAVTASTT
jgi:hypothetical protein